MIAIINYGLGNLNSVANMIRHIGGECCVTDDPATIKRAGKIILPGVGAFDAGMVALKNIGLIETLQTAVMEKGTPILGICLGMQLMTRKSEEGSLPGLGWIDGEVKKFSFPGETNLKIPHMGWNTLAVEKPNPLFGNDTEQRFYFVHSYHVVCHSRDDVLATCTHGYTFVAAFSRKNVYGVQFHPEKSHRFGMALLNKFMELKLAQE